MNEVDLWILFGKHWFKLTSLSSLWEEMPKLYQYIIDKNDGQKNTLQK